MSDDHQLISPTAMKLTPISGNHRAPKRRPFGIFDPITSRTGGGGTLSTSCSSTSSQQQQPMFNDSNNMLLMMPRLNNDALKHDAMTDTADLGKYVYAQE